MTISPLNRISEIYLRDGKVNLAKQTLCDWVLVSSSWLAPLAEAIKMSILQESVIHVDETVLPLLHPVKTINARAWAYVGAESKLVFYEFTTNKKGDLRTRICAQCCALRQKRGQSPSSIAPVC